MCSRQHDGSENLYTRAKTKINIGGFNIEHNIFEFHIYLEHVRQ